MKPTFRRGSVNRDLLVDCFTVVELHGTRRALDAFGVAMRELEGEVDFPIDAADITIFWHIGYASFSPYSITARHMDFVAAHAQTNEIELKALPTYKGLGYL